MRKFLSNAVNSLAIYEISCDFDLTCVIRFICICLIKVWRSVCLQISFTYFSFSCDPFVGEKGTLLSSFSSKRWPFGTLFHFLLGWIWKYLFFISYTFKNDPYLIFDVAWGQIWDNCRRQIVVFCDKTTPSCMSKIFTFFKIGLVVKTISVLTTGAAVIFANLMIFGFIKFGVIETYAWFLLCWGTESTVCSP